MENNKEDLEITQEMPVITDNMKITKETEKKIDTTDKSDKKFETLKKFVKSDVKIKETMYNIAPKNIEDYDKESRIKYVDKLDSTIRDVGIGFNQIAEGFEFGKTVLDAIKEFINSLRNGVAVGGFESGIGSQLYQQTITNMRPDFVEDVKDRFVGYTGAEPSDLAEYIKKSTTVNEALHVMHSYIMNNEEILESMPKLDMKINAYDYPINLYGEMSPIAQKIFDNFPQELDVGFTDIISMQDKVLMMIRDRGHALTIDMDTRNPEEIDLKYFIPKLCNEDMVRALKGIDKSSITRNGARGSFNAKTENIAEELFSFIEKVPMDKDMPSVKRSEEMPNNQQNNNEQLQEKSQEVKEEPIIQSEKPIFSIDDAKNMAIEPDRRMGRIEIFQKKIAEIFNPLMNKFKGKENPEIESNITDRNVDDKNGNER